MYSADSVTDDVRLQYLRMFALQLAEDVAKGDMGDVRPLKPLTLNDSIGYFIQGLQEESATPFECCFIVY